ncbi:hypothetical protein [Microbacterium sp. SLBN-146]|uniref:hypothetical protein n=1 Tax=Microbacterium sp. SLBN-146 TaxID=2768457 RepID=UPI00114FEE2B|nr:hypothetical protein [Microbacterium sp. SLBN-146]
MRYLRACAATIVVATLTFAASGCALSEGSQTEGIDELFWSEAAADARAECLRDRGWDVTQEDEAIIAEVSPDREALYQRDGVACIAQVGRDPDAELTAPEMDNVFSWYMEIADCLEARGYSVPTRPTEQAFLDMYDTDPWIPWIELDGLQLSRAEAQCPALQRPRA